MTASGGFLRKSLKIFNNRTIIRSKCIAQFINNVIHHERNTHMPGGLLDGMRYAVEQGYDYAIAMDAGLSHNPDELPRFIDHPHADLVLGMRTTKTNTPLFRRALSKAGNFVYNASLDCPGKFV